MHKTAIRMPAELWERLEKLSKSLSKSEKQSVSANSLMVLGVEELLKKLGG